MKIKFVGHASFILKANGISLLIDPWVVGTAFNAGWLPYPKPVLTEEDFAGVTHLWISHEHPDHLSIPTLKSIPEFYQKNITVLFQDRLSKEVVDLLKKSGFAKVQELPHAKWISIRNQFSVYCRQIGHLDSTLAIKVGAKTVLNINDCDYPDSTLRNLAKDVGPIDVLFNQFSFAGWIGNSDELERKDAAAKNVLDKFVAEYHILKPKKVVPFASFVRFCHSENCHMNAHANSAQDVVDLLGAAVVVLYPGDVWDMDESHSSVEALRRYSHDLEQIDSQPLIKTTSKNMGEILSVANARVRQFQKNYHSYLLRWVPPVKFYVTDLDGFFTVDLRRGLAEISKPCDDWNIKLSSQAAWFAFKVRYGLPTLGVSGRYQLGQNPTPFLRLKKLGSAFSSGFTSKSETRGVRKFFPPQLLFRYLAKRPADICSQFVARFK